ncbi:hypothetical protein O6H91_11G105400 [Diphasiastrum complanatum]|uniref:Uncharacterized protein n=2 Tax=Diphasiastrum complanatum TaxID=34168 RepID=A0ACC2CCL0_DIPCM|nr:hypothetical protein O6H91_11G105400 [Diphasiastrum complanatum]
MAVQCKESSSIFGRLAAKSSLNKSKGLIEVAGTSTNFVNIASVTSLQSQLLFCYRDSVTCLQKRKRRSTEKLPLTRRLHQIQCFAEKTVVSQPDERQGKERSSIVSLDEILANGPAVEFKLTDFDLYSHVSIGLAGRGDEVVYEGIVRSPNSHLKGMRVVLRQLNGARAQRWGHRALQVIARLIRREDLYHSYATCVHGYILPSDGSSDLNCLTLVHGYYGNYSLHQWLLCADWLPNLEERLALDEEAVRRVGDHRTGGPTVSRQMRLIQVLLRDILIGVNYLHYHGLAHTELQLKNVHISAADRHVKVGILGNAADIPKDSEKTSLTNLRTRDLMIAYDVRCVGFMMARMVLRELMDPITFAHFKEYLMKRNDPAGLREFLLPLLYTASPSGNSGLQILDRDGGAGWNLLSAMLAPKPSERISCTKALRHPFLCGPRWRVESSIETTRWGVGSAAIRIVEEYIYGTQQRNRLAQLVDILERMNPNTQYENWVRLLQGKWRFLYHSGRHIGLTTRQANPAVLISYAMLLFHMDPNRTDRLSTTVTVVFTVMPDNRNWRHDKSGIKGKLKVTATIGLAEGERLYPAQTEKDASPGGKEQPHRLADKPAISSNKIVKAKSSLPRRKVLGRFLADDDLKSLPVMRVAVDDMQINLELDENLGDRFLHHRILQEVRLQVPRELFDLSRVVCATYVDARLLILRSVSGDALVFTRSFLK